MRHELLARSALLGAITDTTITITSANVFDDSNTRTKRRDHISFSLTELADPGVVGLWHLHPETAPPQPSFAANTRCRQSVGR